MTALLHLFLQQSKTHLFLAAGLIALPLVVLPHIGGSGEQLPTNNLIWIAMAIFATLCWPSSIRAQQWRAPKTLLLYLLFIVLLALPITWQSQATAEGTLKILVIVYGLLFIVSLLQWLKEADASFILTVIALSALAQAGLAGYQLIGFVAAHNPGLPMNFFGIFVQRNAFASYCSCGLICALLASHLATPDRQRAARWLLYLLALNTGFWLFITTSRSGAFGLGVALLVLLCRREMRSSLLRLVIVVGLGVLLGWLTSALANLPELRTSADGGYLGSSSGRSTIWFFTTKLIQQNWLEGVGYGWFQAAYAWNQGRLIASQYPDIQPWLYVGHPHNEWLYWFAEGGIVAMLAFTGFVFFWFVRLLRAGQRGIYMLAALTPFALHSLTEFPFYLSALHWFVCLLLLAVFERDETNSNIRPMASIVVARIMQLVPMLLVVSLMISNLYTLYLSHRAWSSMRAEDMIEALNSQRWTVESTEQLGKTFYIAALSIALQQHDLSAVRDFITWADQANAIKPRPNVYRGLIIAHLKLGETVKAEALRQDAALLFRDEEQFKPHQITTTSSVSLTATPLTAERSKTPPATNPGRQPLTIGK